MFFTQEDYLKIENWLKVRAIKDSQFDIVNSINEITDYDYFVFLKNGENKRIKVSNLLSDIILQELGNATNRTISQSVLTKKYNDLDKKIIDINDYLKGWLLDYIKNIETKNTELTNKIASLETRIIELENKLNEITQTE